MSTQSESWSAPEPVRRALRNLRSTPPGQDLVGAAALLRQLPDDWTAGDGVEWLLSGVGEASPK